jgi:hypothetical protein
MPDDPDRQSITSSQQSVPKSFYKTLFVGTPLGEALKNLKMSKAVPDGLKPQECKRGSGHVKWLIPYIPEKDELKKLLRLAP